MTDLTFLGEMFLLLCHIQYKTMEQFSQISERFSWIILSPVTDSENSPCRSPQVDRDSSSLSSPSWPSKESDSQEEASPRLRRGRRRTDEALLRDWSFATPPSPPPLDPPSTPPPVPVRRPRGRPRINPLPEEVDADKDRPTEGGNTSSIKKRKRCKNRKYQNGEYITEKDKVADGEEEKLGVEDGEATSE